MSKAKAKGKYHAQVTSVYQKVHHVDYDLYNIKDGVLFFYVELNVVKVFNTWHLFDIKEN